MTSEAENLLLKRVVQDLQGQLAAAHIRILELVDRVAKLEKWSHPDRAEEFDKVVKNLEEQIDSKQTKER